MLIVSLYTTKCLASYTCTNLRHDFSSSFQIISKLFLKRQKIALVLKMCLLYVTLETRLTVGVGYYGTVDL